jgi:hypothetical protein
MVKEWGLQDYVKQAVGQAWQDFLRHMEDSYPAGSFTDEKLAQEMAEREAQVQEMAARNSHFEAAETSATITSIGALRAARGNEDMQTHAAYLQKSMAAVVLGEGPTPWMMVTKGPDHIRRWGNVIDPEVTQMARAQWNEAARYALQHYLPPDVREECGMEPFTLEWDVVPILLLAQARERGRADIGAAYQEALHAEAGPEPDGHQPQAREPDGPDIDV